jgi:predicted permease
MFERLRIDALSALRSLVATPVPVIATVVTLAVSVGVNLAMFGLIDRAVLSPPQRVDRPERIVTLGFLPPGAKPGSAPMTSTSFVAFTTVRDQVKAFSGAAAFQRQATTVIVNGEQRQVNAMVVSREYFEVLGASPVFGGGIRSGDASADTAAPPVVLSQSFWRSAMASDRGALSRRLSVDTLEYSIAGVMPEGFSGHSSSDVDLWITFDGAYRNAPGWDGDARRNFTSIVARLADGQNVAAAETQASAAIDRPVVLRSTVGADIAAPEKRVAWWLAGVSVAVLLIGLANAATLLVVRGARMRYDVAIRAALGASRARLITQAIVEAVLLAIAATVLSLALGSWMDEAVRRILFPGLIARTMISSTTLWTALASGVIPAIVAAIANTWQLPAMVAASQLAGIGPGGGRRTKTMTTLLLVQTTVCVLLLAGAAMFGGSLYKLRSQDFGMQMSRVLLVDMDAGPGIEATTPILAAALDRIRQLPDVELATPINNVPFTGFNVPPIAVPGREGPPSVGRQLPFLTATTPELFSILGIRLIAGRALTAADDHGAPVVVVNQSMANGVWPGESAIGKCIRIGFPPDWDPSMGPPTPNDKVPCREVVGVVHDVRQRSLLPDDNEDRLMQYFVPFSQVPYPPFMPRAEPQVFGLLVRPRPNSDALAATIHKLIVGDRTDLPFVRVRPYSQVLDRQLRPWSMGTRLLVLFSTLAVGVAAMGLYSAFAYAVSSRRREMAIRIAVGARPSRVMRMVFGEAVMLAGIGSVLGCAAAIGGGRWVRSLLFGVQPSDPLVLGAAAAIMVIVAALATWLPARSASRADPSQLLKTI